jgi:SHS2 domain-containing protein
MLPDKKFEFLEHTADEYIAAYGYSLEEAFENAALAMFETMTDTVTVKPVRVDSINIKARDETSLLSSWLQKLLENFEIEEMLYSKFKVHSISKGPDSYVLKAEVEGEYFDPNNHPSRTSVKAVTYHRMSIERDEDVVTVKFILDI